MRFYFFNHNEEYLYAGLVFRWKNNKKVMKFLKPKNKAHYLKINNKETSLKLALYFSAGLGDYLMFRPFLKEIREFYQNYHISLIGEKNFKDIALAFDKQYFDEFIYFDQYMGYNAFAIDERQYDVLLCIFHNITKFTAYNIKCICAKEKICLVQSARNISFVKREKIVKMNFTKGIYVDENIKFQSLCYKNFFEKLLNKSLDLKFGISLNRQRFKEINFDFSKKYAVIFAGSIDKYRMWNSQNFSKVCDYLYEKEKIISFIAGSDKEDDIAKKIIRDKNYIFSICGKFSMDEISYIVNKAYIILSNDTGGYHLAMNVNDNIICISSGASFKENVDYPKEFRLGKNVSTPLPKSALENFQACEYWHFDNTALNEISSESICKLIKEKHLKKSF